MDPTTLPLAETASTPAGAATATTAPPSSTCARSRTPSDTPRCSAPGRPSRPVVTVLVAPHDPEAPPRADRRAGGPGHRDLPRRGPRRLAAAPHASLNPAGRRVVVCSYCGCESIEVVGRFMGEHVESSTPGPRDGPAEGDAARVVAGGRGASSGLLHPHTTAEEVGLFTLLAQDPSSPSTSGRSARARRPRRGARPHGHGDHASYPSFDRALRLHIDREENGLFPGGRDRLRRPGVGGAGDDPFQPVTVTTGTGRPTRGRWVLRDRLGLVWLGLAVLVALVHPFVPAASGCCTSSCWAAPHSAMVEHPLRAGPAQDADHPRRPDAAEPADRAARHRSGGRARRGSGLAVADHRGGRDGGVGGDRLARYPLWRRLRRALPAFRVTIRYYLGAAAWSSSVQRSMRGSPVASMTRRTDASARALDGHGARLDRPHRDGHARHAVADDAAHEDGRPGRAPGPPGPAGLAGVAVLGTGRRSATDHGRSPGLAAYATGPLGVGRALLAPARQAPRASSPRGRSRRRSDGAGAAVVLVGVRLATAPTWAAVADGYGLVAAVIAAGFGPRLSAPSRTWSPRSSAVPERRPGGVGRAQQGGGLAGHRRQPRPARGRAPRAERGAGGGIDPRPPGPRGLHPPAPAGVRAAVTARRALVTNVESTRLARTRSLTEPRAWSSGGSRRGWPGRARPRPRRGGRPGRRRAGAEGAGGAVTTGGHHPRAGGGPDRSSPPRPSPRRPATGSSSTSSTSTRGHTTSPSVGTWAPGGSCRAGRPPSWVWSGARLRLVGTIVGHRQMGMVLDVVVVGLPTRRRGRWPPSPRMARRTASGSVRNRGGFGVDANLSPLDRDRTRRTTRSR